MTKKIHTDHLFVYGTLLSSIAHPMHRVLQTEADFCGTASVAGVLLNLGAYPGLVPAQTGETVRGEIYRLRTPAKTLATLDAYEGCPGGYAYHAEFRRAEGEARLDSGETLSAWIYFYNRPSAGLARIPGGDYARHARRRMP